MMSSSGFSAFSRLFSSMRRIASCRQPLHRNVGPRAALMRSMWIPRYLLSRLEPFPTAGVKRFGRSAGGGASKAARHDRHGLMADLVGAFSEILHTLFGLGAERFVADRCEVDRAIQTGPADRRLRQEDRDGRIGD